MGSHDLPENVGCRKSLLRKLLFCSLCDIGQLGDEYALSLSVEHCRMCVTSIPAYLGSMQMKFMWQADLHGVANFVIDSLEVHAMLAVSGPDI